MMTDPPSPELREAIAEVDALVRRHDDIPEPSRVLLIDRARALAGRHPVAWNFVIYAACWYALGLAQGLGLPYWLAFSMLTAVGSYTVTGAIERVRPRLRAPTTADPIRPFIREPGTISHAELHLPLAEREVTAADEQAGLGRAVGRGER